MKRSAKATPETAPLADARRVLFTAAGRDPRTWVGGALLAAIVFLVHANDLGNGFVYDDEGTILENPHYRGLGIPQLTWMFTTFHLGHYQPLSWVTLGLDYLLWGENPRGYHLTNLILHVANAVLVYLLALAVVGASPAWERSTAHRPIWVVHVAALVAALLFAVHPLRVESVAWVTERRDVLSSFFLLLAVVFYLHAHGGAAHGRRALWIMLTLVAFVLSLLARALAVTLPALLLVLDWYPLRRLGGSPGGWTGGAARRTYLEKAPFVALALVFAVLAPLAQQVAGARATLAELGLLERLTQACYGLLFYLWKTAVPLGLSPLYEIPEPMVLSSAKYVVPVIVVAAAALVLFRYGQRWPWLTVVVLAHAILLAPVLGLVQSGSQEVADRYSYLPAVGWALLVSAALLWLWHRARPAALACAGLSLLSIVGLAALTWRQSRVWHDSVSLWEQATRAAPSVTTHQNLGAAYARTGRLPDAITQYRTALQLDPLNKPSLHGLAKALTDTNRLDEAAQAWEQLLQRTPDNARAHLLFANVQRTRGKPEEAAYHYTQALRLDPSLTEARFGRAALWAEQGKLDEAAAECRKVLESEPDHPGAHYTLGNILAQQRNFAEAVTEFRRALAVNPDFLEAGTNLGVTLEWLGQREEAVLAYRAVLERHPEQLVTRYNLATALSKLGRHDEAIAEYRELLNRNPNNAAARRALDTLLSPTSRGS